MSPPSGTATAARGSIDAQAQIDGFLDKYQVRHIRMTGLETLDDPRVDALIAEAASASEPRFDPAGEGRLVIRSVSAKQRPRR